jgi:hypothetical protein
LEALQSRARGLEAERQVLRQNLEECGVASILLGLSSGGHETPESVELDTASPDGAAHMVELLSTGKRKRFLSESMAEQHAIQAQCLSITIDGEVTTIGGAKSQINWKTGTYRDEHGHEKQLTSEQLEELRCVPIFSFPFLFSLWSFIVYVYSLTRFISSDVNATACMLK